MAIRKKATPQRQSSIGERLLDAVDDIDRPGDVCISGNRAIVMPGLAVDNLGPIGLPLTEQQAKELIKRCRQAPYGKGTETVVDTSVRRVWELDPTQFQLSNPKWPEFVDSLVTDIRTAFGLVGQKLEAHLYKLLIYEAGGFFLPHRDGEKIDRMVGTLVIGLPAAHTGGELIVSHEGHSYQIELDGAASGHELSFAAFYADCQHEIRPVTSWTTEWSTTLGEATAGRRLNRGMSGPG